MDRHRCAVRLANLPPLSVSSDRIAVAAWRCARLLDALRPNERSVDRTGKDHIFGLGRTILPPRGDKTHEPRISREGWIHLPEKTALEQLV